MHPPRRVTLLTLLSVETIGYCGRIWSHYDIQSIGGFVLQAILILVAPALFAASIYMILGRLIRSIHADSLSIIPLRYMTKIFVIADVVSFTLQAGGGGIQAGGTLELYNIGEKIIVAGLFFQIVSFGFFIFTASLFHIRATSHHSIIPKTSIPWQRHLWILYAASALILVRSIFRVVEYLQGNSGYLISHEIFLYFFDTLLMASTMIVFLVWYVDDLTRVPTSQSSGHRSSDSGEVMLRER